MKLVCSAFVAFLHFFFLLKAMLVHQLSLFSKGDASASALLGPDGIASAFLQFHDLL